MLASTPIIYNKGKNDIFKIVDTHLKGPNWLEGGELPKLKLYKSLE
jgi:hypothetical protein